MPHPIPIIIVTGFLGAGKTTLMRRLIADAYARDLRAGVIVNEFGTLDVDSHILQSADAELLSSIAGGCACCSGQDELHWALEEIAARPESTMPSVILLETSGAADPVVLLDVLTAPQLLEPYRIAALVCVADATRWNSSDDAQPTLGALLQRQLQIADTILLNKADLTDQARLAANEKTLEALNPNARVARAVHCEIDFEEFWQHVFTSPHESPRAGQLAPTTNHLAPIGVSKPKPVPLHGNFQTLVCPLPHPVERGLLEVALSRLPETVWRVKGFVRLHGQDSLCLVQYTGGQVGTSTGENRSDASSQPSGRWTFAPFHLPPFAEEPPLSLVFIGSALDSPKILRDFGGMALLTLI
jgi:G3E family GTPase